MSSVSYRTFSPSVNLHRTFLFPMLPWCRGRNCHHKKDRDIFTYPCLTSRLFEQNRRWTKLKFHSCYEHHKYSHREKQDVLIYSHNNLNSGLVKHIKIRTLVGNYIHTKWWMWLLIHSLHVIQVCTLYTNLCVCQPEILNSMTPTITQIAVGRIRIGRTNPMTAWAHRVLNTVNFRFIIDSHKTRHTK